MKKSDIKARLTEIDNRLNELPTICEREQRELSEAETNEKNMLIAERSDLQKQLKEIEDGEKRAAQIHIPAGEEKPFSLIEQIRSIVNGGRFEGKYADEVRGMADKAKLSYEGDILMKASAPELRTLDGILTGTNNFTSNTYNGGHEMVPTDVLPIIEAVYNYTVLERAGANFYNGLVGDTKLPVMSMINFGFKAENADADKVTPTMGKVDLTPKRLTGEILISKQLLRQTSQDIETRLRLSIAKAIAQALEVAILGYGTSPHNGMMYNATTVALASTTYDTVLGLAQSIYSLNYNPTFVVDPMAARFLKQKARLSGGLEAIMYGGQIDNEPTFITNSVKVSTATSGAITCADFSHLHVGTWGDLLDITVDPLSQSGKSLIRLVLNYYCDWGWDTANGTAYASREITNA